MSERKEFNVDTKVDTEYAGLLQPGIKRKNLYQLEEKTNLDTLL